VLCFDREINGLKPCSLDSGMQTDALVLCKYIYIYITCVVYYRYDDVEQQYVAIRNY